MKGRTLVVAAALLILPDAPRVADADPPSDSPWEMTFNGEFQRQDVSLEKWVVRSRSPYDRPEAEVLRDNVEIHNGACRLSAKKGDEGRWTNGQIVTKAFKQKYGYFEARIKISSTTGFTNVFALINYDRVNTPQRFYIDVVNAVYPHRHCTRLAALGAGTAYPTESHGNAEELSKDYHLYGLQWTDREVIWYVDGREIRRVSHTVLRHPAKVQLVTWGNGFDGEATSPMEVDYVRVYKKLHRPPNLSDPNVE